MKPRTKRIVGQSLTAAGATLVVVAAMLWLSGALRGDKIVPGTAAPPPVPPVGQTAVVQLEVRPHEAEVVGTIQAETRTAIAARVVANIRKIHKTAGQAVEAGEALVDLVDDDLKARVRQAEAALKAADAARKLAEVQRDNKRESFAKGAATRLEVDESQARYEVADAESARARQLLDEARISLGYAQVVAPYKGVVIDRLAVEGEQASPGKPLLTIYDPSRLRLEASVRETYIGYLEKDQRIAVYIGALRDPASRQRSGTLQEIVPAADPLSRSFLVKVALDASNAAGLYPGMFGRMRLPLEPQERLLIPQAAVEQVGQLTLVRVVDGNRVQRRAVRLGERLGQQMEVLAGLSQGERVALP